MKDYKTHKFLRLLNKNNFKYHYEGKWLVIDGYQIILTHGNLTFIPDYIKFNTNKYVHISFNPLTSLPDNIEFNNKGYVSLANNKLKSLPDNIKFNNDGHVNLSNNFLTSLPDNIKFNNKYLISFYNNPLESLPDNIEEFYDRLDKLTKDDLKEKFPDHWFFDKERFGL